MTSLYRCALGDHDMTDTEPRFQRVVAWEKPGRGLHDRSGSSLVLREALPVFACGICVARHQAGLDVRQMSL